MNQLEFGEKPKKVRYAVIVCPKCKQHAQITEVGKKTLGCQHCGVLLQARKLRIFYFSEDLADAVAFRTRLQAEISGKEREIFSLKPSDKNYDISISESEETIEKILKQSGSRISWSRGFKKDYKAIFLEILKASGGIIEIKEFQQKAMEKGISLEKFDTILKKFLETGEIYSPEPGVLKLV